MLYSKFSSYYDQELLYAWTILKTYAAIKALGSILLMEHLENICPSIWAHLVDINKDLELSRSEKRCISDSLWK